MRIAWGNLCPKNTKDITDYGSLKGIEDAAGSRYVR
jgi:hypothetical protein